MPKDQIHFRPTPENLEWLRGKDNINKHLNELVDHFREAAGGSQLSEERAELQMIDSRILSLEKIMREHRNEYQFLHFRKEKIEEYLREFGRAEADRKSSELLAAVPLMSKGVPRT